MKLSDSFKNWIQYLKQRKSISLFDIAIFFRQFATLISAGIPITQSCDVLAKCQQKNALRLLIYEITREIFTGKSLFDSLRKHPQYFDELTCRLVQIGEQTGKLEMVLSFAANYHEKNQLLKRNIKQALFYPSIVAVVALIVTLCMFLFIVPRFAELFQETRVQLPLITIWIFYFSAQLRKYIWLMMIIFILCLLMCFRLNYTKSKSRLRRLFNHLPIIQLIIYKVILARFARHLALTISAGIPITNALILTANASGHAAFTHAVIQLSKKIKSGFTLHQAMAVLPLFPILMIQMVKIGEESGMLEDMINKFADFTEADIHQLTQRLNQLLEPLIMVVLGVLIGGLVIGMYLPIFKLGNAI